MINTRGNLKRQKRLTGLIKSLHPLQEHVTGAQRKAIVYFLETSTVDETRRSRSDSRGAPADVASPQADALPKDSAKY